MNAKKSLKNRVNENGFYINFVADHLTYTDAVKKAKSVKPENVMFDSKEEIPEGENIIVLSGILSQNYPVWKKSRNGYKIDQKGVDYTDYKYNNIVLLQHNDELGWIGRARMIYLDNKGNSNIIMYVDLNTIADENTRYQIKEWYIKWVSTGHALLESKFEDAEDWKLLEAQEAADKYGYDEVWYAYFGMSDKLIYVVTKASMIENSVVTIGSNEKAILSHDTIGNCALKNAMNSDMLKYLLSNKDNMKKDKLVELIENSALTKKEQAEAIELVNSIEETPVEEPTEEVKEEEVVEETTEETPAEETPVEEPVEEVATEENDTEAKVTEEAPVEEEKPEEPVEEPAEEAPVEEPTEEVKEETNDVEETAEEPEAPVEEPAEEAPAEEETPTEDCPEECDKEEEEVEEKSESDEKLTNEISSLKNELSELRDLVNSLVKDKEEMAEVIMELWDLSLKNSKNLSNIVTLWVSEVSTVAKKENGWMMRLRDALKKNLNK